MSELEDVQTTVAVIDGLRSRIAELEAEFHRWRLEMMRALGMADSSPDVILTVIKMTVARAEQTEAALAEQIKDFRSFREAAIHKVQQAESGLAELTAGLELEGEPTGVSVIAALRNMTMNWQRAEAALAERDRMLHFCIERIALTPERWNGWTTNEVLADLRARAEEGGE